MKKNIFYQIGHYCLTKRFLYSWLILMGLAIASSALFCYFELAEVTALEKTFEKTQRTMAVSLRKRAKRDQFLNHHVLADSYYLDKQIESLTFLAPEIESLKGLVGNPAFAKIEETQKVLDTLQKNNRIRFTEGEVIAEGKVQETEESQVSPILVNQSDLEILLNRVEGVSIGNLKPPKKLPQLLIKNFHLRKIPLLKAKDLYSIQMTLLKREFLKPKRES